MSEPSFYHKTPAGLVELRPHKNGCLVLLNGKGIAWYSSAENAARDLQDQIDHPKEQIWHGYEGNDERPIDWTAFPGTQFPQDLSEWESSHPEQIPTHENKGQALGAGE